MASGSPVIRQQLYRSRKMDQFRVSVQKANRKYADKPYSLYGLPAPRLIPAGEYRCCRKSPHDSDPSIDQYAANVRLLRIGNYTLGGRADIQQVIAAPADHLDQVADQLSRSLPVCFIRVMCPTLPHSHARFPGLEPLWGWIWLLVHRCQLQFSVCILLHLLRDQPRMPGILNRKTINLTKPSPPGSLPDGGLPVRAGMPFLGMNCSGVT